MGDVVSFAKAGQTDIFSMFDAACPSLPEETNREVVETAQRSVGATNTNKPATTRAACLVIVALSAIGIALSFFSASSVERRTVVASEFSSKDAAVAAPAEAIEQSVNHRFDGAFSGSFSSNLVMTDEFTLDHLQTDDPAWRLSRETWLAHIAALESNPFYQQVVREKRLFSMTHPDQPE